VDEQAVALVLRERGRGREVEGEHEVAEERDKGMYVAEEVVLASDDALAELLAHHFKLHSAHLGRLAPPLAVPVTYHPEHESIIIILLYYNIK
jgi:hypothetical protein